MSHFYKRRSRFQSNPSASRIPVYYIIEVIGFVFGVIVILDDFGTNKQPTSLTTTIADQEIKGFIKMPELDLDNFEEILERSQVEDLIRCKSVFAAGEVGDYPAVKYGTLCNGMIHWLCSDRIVSFDLSKEVIIEIPIPDQLDRLKCYGYTSTLGTIKDRLCIIYKDKCYWDKKIEEKIEIWVLKNYNVMKTEGIEIEQWLPPPGYDEHKTKMKYTPHEDFFYGHVHIWMLEEGSGAPVLVHSFESPGHNTHIKLSTISECNYNFDRPVYVKSLVSPNGMGDDDSGNGGRLESKGNTSSSSLDHCHTKSCETLEECHTICNKSQRFAKISKICKNLKDLQKSHKTKKHL